MVKKIFTLVMVISVLGAFLGGCGSKTEEGAAPAATAGAAGGEAPATTTTGG